MRAGELSSQTGSTRSAGFPTNWWMRRRNAGAPTGGLPRQPAGGVPGGAAGRPLRARELADLGKCAARVGLAGPALLFGLPAADIQELLGIERSLADRIEFLLARGGQLALDVERPQSRGIWQVTKV